MAHWAAEKKAVNLRLYSVREHCSYADHVLICSGTSDRHVIAIADYLREQSKKSGVLPLGVEGIQQGQWVLLDFGEVIAHVFYDPVRDYYELDRMWGHADQVEIEGVTASASTLADSLNASEDDDDE
ncbi:MAG: ribosome silencing factor [Deltaproteobacteria bacterium]|nr:MAG: ribosome silencing factor [Deltaproteobacteria bacterium]